MSYEPVLDMDDPADRTLIRRTAEKLWGFQHPRKPFPVGNLRELEYVEANARHLLTILARDEDYMAVLERMNSHP